MVTAGAGANVRPSLPRLRGARLHHLASGQCHAWVACGSATPDRPGMETSGCPSPLIRREKWKWTSSPRTCGLRSSWSVPSTWPTPTPTAGTAGKTRSCSSTATRSCASWPKMRESTWTACRQGTSAHRVLYAHPGGQPPSPGSRTWNGSRLDLSYPSAAWRGDVFHGPWIARRWPRAVVCL